MGYLIIKSDSQNHCIELGSKDTDQEMPVSVYGTNTYWISKTEAELIILHLKEQFEL
jgi:hypothetical protein